MNALDKLKMNKFIKELDYLESEEEYHTQLFVEINSLFMTEVQDKMIVVDQETEEKYGDFVEKEKEKQLQKEETKKQEIPKGLKKTYKKLLSKTHPDRFVDGDDAEREEMEEIYKKVISCAESGNWVEMIKTAEKLGIDIPEVDKEMIKQIQEQIKLKKQKINTYVNSFQWAWYHEDNGTKKDTIVDNFIQLQTKK